VHLPRVLPALEDLHRRRPLKLTVISNSRPGYESATRGVSFPARYVEWSHRAFVQSFPEHDICIIPIEPNPFTTCKTGNRVALSLKLGVPVIADPIPSFEEFAPFVLLGDWVESLERYASDRPLREAHIHKGRQYVEATYTRERVVSQWSGLFDRLLADAPNGTRATVTTR
jgi:glycosyltransferase involved in cell wall biosynthesis